MKISAFVLGGFALRAPSKAYSEGVACLVLSE